MLFNFISYRTLYHDAIPYNNADFCGKTACHSKLINYQMIFTVIPENKGIFIHTELCNDL